MYVIVLAFRNQFCGILVLCLVSHAYRFDLLHTVFFFLLLCLTDAFTLYYWKIFIPQCSVWVV